MNKRNNDTLLQIINKNSKHNTEYYQKKYDELVKRIVENFK